MTGALVLVAALVATALLALVMQRRNGRFTSRPVPDVAPAATDDRPPGDVAPGGADRPRVTADEIGGALGDRLTLVQFSSAFCSPCRATRALLTDVVSTRPDVAHVEVDAESHLDLVRRLNILRTPTVLVVDADGVVLSRASGLPRRDQVVAVLDA